mmetsp:Transcript_35164/g.91353  ORF Transcript_35164/g.91353 Transcript_35164/m.91353 type:complete len:242 (-) Transcript_35164:698-1423(-)
MPGGPGPDGTALHSDSAIEDAGHKHRLVARRHRGHVLEVREVPHRVALVALLRTRLLLHRLHLEGPRRHPAVRVQLHHKSVRQNWPPVLGRVEVKGRVVRAEAEVELVPRLVQHHVGRGHLSVGRVQRLQPLHVPTAAVDLGGPHRKVMRVLQRRVVKDAHRRDVSICPAPAGGGRVAVLNIVAHEQAADENVAGLGVHPQLPLPHDTVVHADSIRPFQLPVWVKLGDEAQALPLGRVCVM